MATDKRPVEIICSACGQDTFLRRNPKYDGFKRVGEELACASCGHLFAGEKEVPFKQKKTSTVFSEADRPAPVTVFSEADRPAPVKIDSLHEQEHRFCRYCAHYVVNPFSQRCSLYKKEVEATDTCGRFKPPPPPEKPEI